MTVIVLASGFAMFSCCSFSSDKQFAATGYDAYRNEMYFQAIDRVNLRHLDLLIKRGANVNSVIIKGKRVSTLYYALSKQHEGVSEFFVEKNANVTYVDPKTGYTPLMWAIRWDFYDTAIALIERGADVNAVDKLKRNVLDWAVGRRVPLRIFESLFSHGARITSNTIIDTVAKNHIDFKTMQYLYEKCLEMGVPQKADPLVLAVLENDEGKVRQILAANQKKINAKSGDVMEYAVGLASGLGYVSTIRAYHDYGFEFYNKDVTEINCMQIAAHYGQNKVIKELMSYGQSVNEITGSEYPVLLAIRYDHPETVQFLMDNGANSFTFRLIPYQDSYDVLLYALRYSGVDTVKILMSYGLAFDTVKYPFIPKDMLEAKNPVETVAFLQENGYDINAHEAGNSSLPASATLHSIDITVFKWIVDRMDLQAFTDKEIRSICSRLITYYGQDDKLEYFFDKLQTVDDILLVDAIDYQNIPALRILRSKGADLDVRKDGMNLLQYAAYMNGNEDVIDYLISQGMNIDAVSDAGMTALMYCAEEGYYEGAKKLLDAGADITIRNANGKTAKDIAKKKKFKLLLEYMGE